jgi:acetoin utilization protein AcuB
MLVKHWMSTPPITVKAEASIQKAIKLIEQHNIRMLPLIEEDQLVGIVTKGDLKQATTSDVVYLETRKLDDLTKRIKIKMVMTKNPITVPYNYTIEETAMEFLLHNISGVPVLGRTKKAFRYNYQLRYFTSTHLSYRH